MSNTKNNGQAVFTPPQQLSSIAQEALGRTWPGMEVRLLKDGSVAVITPEAEQAMEKLRIDASSTEQGRPT